VRFWDSSAIVPLVVEEAHSRACRQLLRTDPVLVVWSLTRTEITSAICRQHRGGSLSHATLAAAEDRIAKLSTRWAEVVALDLVRIEAERLLRRHPLRAADALQLGAAYVWSEGKPRGKLFVGLDDALLSAAQSEGFQTVIPGTK
jgi:predicted nucleic acid-binding protein